MHSRGPTPASHPATAALACTPALRELLRSIPTAGGSISVGGAAGSLPVTAVATLADHLPTRLWILTASSPDKAGEYLGDLEALAGPGTAVPYPQGEELAPGGDRNDEVEGQRVEAVEALLAGQARVMVTTHRALQELVPIPDDVAELRFTVATGGRLRRDALIEALEARGFERSPMVEAAGSYTVRGGLIDVFSYGAAGPVRIEFLGDEIESIRHFGVLDQRSTETVARADILPVRFGATIDIARRTDCSLLDRLPRDAVLVRIGDDTVHEEAMAAWKRADTRYRDALRYGNPATDPATVLLSPEALAERVARYGRVTFVEEHVGSVVFQARRPPAIERHIGRLRSFLSNAAAAGEETFILCDNDGQASRLDDLLADRRGTPPPNCHLVVGSLTQGYLIADSAPSVNILTDHEIFRRGRKLRRRRRFRGSASLESLAQLAPGDHVVHMEHGIGRFRGLERIEIGGESIEALVIGYSGGEVLRVPVYRLDEVERWVGTHPEDKPAGLHRIGGKRWRRLKRKTEAAIHQMTAELLELYAARRARPGYAFSPDTRWQREMEAAFVYEDTPDQRTAVEDIKRDMESSGVMDRLVCGDAGYGKTEVAIRAAFKAVQDGKQVAVLAPTTVLVAQHARTFGDRLADYPVVVRSLSRFDPPRRQREVAAGLLDGTVDIVIGTHRLLSGDIAFRDLGLVVIDEEQRLGVRQKERLKKLRTTVDALTLTATPIPRTLYLSLAGIRDLSLIRTPPRDRMAILTHVISWSDHLVAEACQRELDRGGQVFFLHNRVETIDTAAERVRRLVGDATVDVAHGQMGTGPLDRAMTRFVEGRTQVLVCSSIIENGLDVANANTLIVAGAHRFGLSQLYQIRGRVGRWDRRAYCYLVVPDNITEEAEKRLRVLEHFTELGSGYQIALRDLEVRGAGNLLGEHQSGFAHAVGLDTYMRLMEDAVRRVREGDRGVRHPRPEIAMSDSAYLPDDYIQDQHQKLHLYRRLAKVSGPSDVEALADEITDRFGRPPPAVRRLLDQSLLGLAGRSAGVDRILVRGSTARVNFRPEVIPRISALEGTLKGEAVALEVRRITPLSITFTCEEADRLAPVLVRALATLGGGTNGDK
ncbi:MAG: transcription-repair coupling factor [Gemmatimonadota bacterium]|nr:transcription-repair coupling factor [Gemmatimonadota bacterium]